MIMLLMREIRHIDKGGRGVSPQDVVVGFWKCFQSISRVEKPLYRQKNRKNRLLWPYLGSFKSFPTLR